MSDVMLKDAGATLDIENDWDDDAAADGPYFEATEVIETPYATNSTWVAIPDDALLAGGLVLSAPTIDVSETKAGVTLAAGVPGKTYHVVNQVITSLGRTEQRTRVVMIGER